MQKRSIGTIIAAFLGAAIVAAVAYAQPGLSFNKDATLTGTGTVASPIRVNTTTLAGTGLTASGTALAVGCGTGLTCAADSVSISSAVATTAGCSTGTVPVHSSTSGLDCSQWGDTGTIGSYLGTGGIAIDYGTITSGLNAYLTLTSSIVGTRSVVIDDDLIVRGDNSNDQSQEEDATLDIISGRDASHALNSGQSTGDISIQSGADDGGFRHWISSTHSGTASQNSLRFWVNNSATSELSSVPGTGNANALDLYGDADARFYGSVGIGADPSTKLHVSVASSGLTPVASTSATLETNGDNYLSMLSSGTKAVLFGNASSSADGGVTYDAVARGMQLRTGGNTTRVTIDSAGLATFAYGLTSTAAASTFGDLRGTAQVYTTPTGTQTITLDASTSVLRFNATAQVDVIGLTGGVDGRVVFIQNTGSGNVYFYEEHGSATAANRIKVDANTGSALLVNSKGMAIAVYNGTASRWQYGSLPVFNYPTAVSFPGTLAVAQAATLSSTLAVTSTSTFTGSIAANGAANTIGDANTDTHTFNGHVHTTGTDPTLSSCGTSPSIIGSDTAGTVTIGTGGVVSDCTITFATAYTTNAPACVVTSRMSGTSIGLYISAASTSAITVSKDAGSGPFPASGVFSYHCIGVP